MKVQPESLEFTRCSRDDIAKMILSDAAESVTMLATCNLDHIYNLGINENFRRAYEWASIKTVDSMPLHAYLRYRMGDHAPPHVTGSDLVPIILEDLNSEAHRVVMISPNDKVGGKISEYLIKKGFPDISTLYISPRHGFDKSEIESDILIRKIVLFNPTHVFFALGSPKSECWIYNNRNILPKSYYLCIGAGLEYASGDKYRAPRWMQKLSLEWLWRLCSEPRRLFPRYLNNFKILIMLILKM